MVPLAAPWWPLEALGVPLGILGGTLCVPLGALRDGESVSGCLGEALGGPLGIIEALGGAWWRPWEGVGRLHFFNYTSKTKVSPNFILANILIKIIKGFKGPRGLFLGAEIRRSRKSRI